jgi:hypothetical protein
MVGLVRAHEPAKPDGVGYLFVSLMYGHWKMLATLGFSDNWNRVSRETMDRLVGFYLRH